jgi:hypothetical protein
VFDSEKRQITPAPAANVKRLGPYPAPSEYPVKMTLKIPESSGVLRLTRRDPTIVAVPLPLRRIAIAFMAAVLALPSAWGQQASKPVVYNDLEGDGSQELDRVIKEAYSKTYTIRDTRPADGYTEPNATAGDLPKEAKDDAGQLMAGYVLAVYIVGVDGTVENPLVLRSSDPRLNAVALNAMAHWRFTPGKLNGEAVASTAAQEFTFGPGIVTSGYHMSRLIVYQDGAVLARRLPSKKQGGPYLLRLAAIAHNFFVGYPTPETFDIIVMLRPGGRSRVWFFSSRRSGTAPELEPLRILLEAVPVPPVTEGPALLTLAGTIMGGDGQMPEDLRPIPAEWRDIEKGLPEPLPVSSDAFLDLAWPDAK